MSPALEKVVYKALKRKPEEIGQVELLSLPVGSLIATRTFLNSDRLFRTNKRRAAICRPEVIIVEGNNYVLDGHHKVRRAPHGSVIECRVLDTKNRRIKALLERRDAGPVDKLPIR